MLNEGRPARVYPARWRNARGLPGLRLVYVDRVQGEPILYAVATWEQQGRPMNRPASTAKHGRLGAVERVMRQREKGIGQSLGLTPRQALNRMRAAL